MFLDTGVTANFAYGEYNMGVNKRALHEKGCDILIGTPGRLKGLLKEGFLKVDKLEYLVLDEADRLLDFNFMDDIIEMTKVPGFSSVCFLWEASNLLLLFLGRRASNIVL